MEEAYISTDDQAFLSSSPLCKRTRGRTDMSFSLGLRLRARRRETESVPSPIFLC